ncbi:Helix-turn-helix domain-containing protein [Streptoalloteichus tenebrarius]|uniref:Helix-turn-helix domain-containing protein n=1 Tax=Streptoalloteichus tenebrarius (strain ATCC 17920 / DSM 40477 / JCM 4838 / CBS 697.72 / NBRC 16177 / NCIMB 11028 / NRRL B-12390 / A12253. 1 / ISP 5477) TaxID=1933 RepID=A0ABT1HTK8_STRSD|nr:helix-turn-helix transcriptional regulator [Streptoalloteichus tenebrarius]MCP2258853.1 Helix-turn-helix domain-containing protein [Streptoalloteichus tenebrarius]
MDHEAALIGQRVREIRAWRKMSVTVTAELAGITKGYLSLIERGQRAVTKRTTLEALAQALRVSPTDLLGKPYAPHDAASDEAHAGIPELTAVLSGWRVGEIPDVKVREWGAIQADVDQLNAVLRANADYAAQSRLVPALTKELLAAVNTSHRVKALIGLMCTYKAAAYLAHDLGVQGLPTLAAERMRQVAEELDDPVWLSYAAYQRAQVVSGNNRPRQYELAAAVADMPGARVETRGLANLTAALAAATTGRHDLAHTHLAEAANLAETIEADVSPWMNTNFGRENTNIWKVSVGLELGDGAKAAELASRMRPTSVSKSRQAQFWIDYGRALLTDRRHSERGLAAILHAEQIAPQKVRNNAFVREAVVGLLTTARRDAGGRDLRGLAYRIGVGV